jgi:endoglucanase
MLQALLIFASLVLAAAGGAGAAAAPSGPSALTVNGNRLVDEHGSTVHLRGVNRVSPEYACTYGEIASGPLPGHQGYNPLDATDAAAIASWHPTAVRLPLNEDCWLGQHGMPASPLTAATYRKAIVDYVGLLHARGLYVILDLHWSNPANLPNGQGLHPLPGPTAPEFWESVAQTFADDGAVVFDAFNEPYDPSTRGDPSHPVSWTCWRDGGCEVPAAPDTQPPDPEQTYVAVGMQAIVDAIRSTGARQPIMLGGLEYANDLSGWLAHEPDDPAGALVASFHNYTPQECNTEACWDEQVAPVAAAVPVVAGEFGEMDCPSSGLDPDNFDNTFMRWADAHGVGYLGWGWVIPDPPRDCSTPYLISDYRGTPVDPNGVALHAHLARLWAAGQPPPAGGTAGPGAGTATESSPDIAGALAAFLRRAGKPPSAAKLLRANGWKARFRAPFPGFFRVRWEQRGATGQGGTRLLARGSRRFDRSAGATVWLRLTRAGRLALARNPNLSARLAASFHVPGGSAESKAVRVSPAG